MVRETAQMVRMNLTLARSASAGSDSSSARTATAPPLYPYVMLTKIALMALMKTMLFVIIISVPAISGNVPTNAVSQNPGNVTVTTTAEITLMKIAHIVPAGPVSQAILSVPMVTAFPRTGSVM